LDTSALDGLSGASSYTVLDEDGNSLYTGALHGYGYVNEKIAKGDGETGISYTMDNWVESTDPTLYLYLPAKSQTITVNGKAYNVVWDAETAGFLTTAAADTPGTDPVDPETDPETPDTPSTDTPSVKPSDPYADVWDGVSLDLTWFEPGKSTYTVSNIVCDRYASENYGDGESVGLIGRIGVHDNDPVSIRPVGAGVRNIAVKGSFYANRSVGGIVGKIGKTNGGVTIENCANFASVTSTDSKGVGGIVGASWNGGVIRNCYNAGAITAYYGKCPAGGIAGSNEIKIENCYNIGTIKAASDSFAMAIGSSNGGAQSVTNCYWLSGVSAGGGYYGSYTGSVTEMSVADMQAASFADALGSAFVADTAGINGGYPILSWQATDASIQSTNATPVVSEGVAAVSNDTSINQDEVSEEAEVYTTTQSIEAYEELGELKQAA
jgi:hypothetical protein